MRKEYKRIFENIISLGVLNGINLLIPLVTLPYLIKTVGIEKYGVYSVVYSMLQYGIIFTAYGFGFSTTQQIAQNRENIDKVIGIVNATLICRIIIMIGFMMIMGGICWIAYSKEYFIMYLWGLGIILGDILNPTWLYQGMEKMRFMTVINLISKTVFTLLIFVFIREESDYPYITLLNSIGYLISGGVSLWIGYKKFNIKFRIPKNKHIHDQFNKGWYMFLSTISMNLYRNSNVFILGLFLTPGLVGIYSGAEKVIKAYQAIVSPVSNALFPFVSRSFNNLARIQQWRQIKKFCVYIGFGLTVLTGIAFWTAPLANKILLDNLDFGAVVLIRIMTPVIFFGGLNYILGIVGLINVGAKKSFFNCVTISGIFSLILLLLLVKPYGVLSGGISMTVCEVVLFMLCILKWEKYKREVDDN